MCVDICFLLQDKAWLKTIEFIPYAGQKEVQDEADADRLQDILTLQLKDLHALLSFPYHVFWSHVRVKLQEKERRTDNKPRSLRLQRCFCPTSRSSSQLAGF